MPSRRRNLILNLKIDMWWKFKASRKKLDAVGGIKH
jgi:hypothetical protein